MNETRSDRWKPLALAQCLAIAAGVIGTSGCATEPNSRELRLEGQRAMIRGEYGAARGLFLESHGLVPEDAINLHDLGDCCLHFSRKQFRRRNTAAAMREVDAAIEYYQRAINAHPGFQAALVGKNIALELKGQFEEALKVAEWAAEFVGPAARQQIFLAREMEERGDLDAARLRLLQAVAMEPANASAHEELGLFYYRIGDEDLAVRHLTRAHRLDPTRRRSAAALRELGVPVQPPQPGQ